MYAYAGQLFVQNRLRSLYVTPASTLGRFDRFILPSGGVVTVCTCFFLVEVFAAKWVRMLSFVLLRRSKQVELVM